MMVTMMFSKIYDLEWLLSHRSMRLRSKLCRLIRLWKMVVRKNRWYIKPKKLLMTRSNQYVHCLNLMKCSLRPYTLLMLPRFRSLIVWSCPRSSWIEITLTLTNQWLMVTILNRNLEPTSILSQLPSLLMTISTSRWSSSNNNENKWGGNSKFWPSITKKKINSCSIWTSVE